MHPASIFINTKVLVSQELFTVGRAILVFFGNIASACFFVFSIYCETIIYFSERIFSIFSLDNSSTAICDYFKTISKKKLSQSDIFSFLVPMDF
ncbi:MAG TPA: hypothetical protein DCY48_00330 [Candidatus Magasanikbacteria bacterium]|nr:hypothetical protein [Candidatus Magasanikbacteria bacterium]